jgi:hypothetical protein
MLRWAGGGGLGEGNGVNKKQQPLSAYKSDELIIIVLQHKYMFVRYFDAFMRVLFHRANNNNHHYQL